MRQIWVASLMLHQILEQLLLAYPGQRPVNIHPLNVREAKGAHMKYMYTYENFPIYSSRYRSTCDKLTQIHITIRAYDSSTTVKTFTGINSWTLIDVTFCTNTVYFLKI